MWNLVADIGGTNMRLAAVSADGGAAQKPLRQHMHPTSGPIDVLSACAALIAEQGSTPAHVVIAAAGVVRQGEVKLTNSAQGFSETALAQISGTPNVKILNDFEAAAWSLATVAPKDVAMLQGAFDTMQAPRLIIGPGTGLGVGAMVWSHGRPHVVSGEGGHVTLAPQSEDEFPYFRALVELWPEVRAGSGVAVEAEAILSGTGIPKFHQAITMAQGGAAQPQTAEMIFAAARRGDDPVAARTIALFQRYLGSVAGDLGLVFDAKGGIFMTGGVALSNPWLFDDSFLAAFNAGGRHSSWRQALPVCLYQNKDFGLIGAQNYITNK